MDSDRDMKPRSDPEMLKLCKWGVYAFTIHALLNILGLVVWASLELRYRASSLINPFELPYAFWMYFFIFLLTVPSIILAPITYYKLYKPLKNNTFSHVTKRWNLVLSIFGFLYALIIGGLFLVSAYKKWEVE